jgi:hypothetical protein
MARKTIVSTCCFELGIARRLTIFYSAEETLKRPYLLVLLYLEGPASKPL